MDSASTSLHPLMQNKAWFKKMRLIKIHSSFICMGLHCWFRKKTCSRHFFLHSNNFSRSAHLGFSVVIIEIHIFRHHHKLTNTYIFPLPKVFRTLMVVKISYHRLTGIVVDSVSNFAIIRKSHCHLKKSKLSKLRSLSSKASIFVCLALS